MCTCSIVFRFQSVPFKCDIYAMINVLILNDNLSMDGIEIIFKHENNSDKLPVTHDLK